MLGLLSSGLRPLIAAHRGASAAAPENTLAAFRAAIDLGADVIELDVQRTADGHLIVIHDPTVDRTTNGQGAVASYSLAALKALDAGGWFSPRFASERLPTLQEAVETVGSAAGLFIEIKQGPVFDDGIEVVVAAVIRDAGLVARCEVSSFDHFSVRRIKDHAPEVACGILYEARLIDPFGAARLAAAEIVHPYWALSTPELVEEAHRLGYGVVVWTVNDPEAMARLAASGVDAIVTDVPDVLRRVLDR